jgi:hypothetical protein
MLNLVLDDPDPPTLWYDAFENAPASTRICLTIQGWACVTPAIIQSGGLLSVQNFDIRRTRYSTITPMHHYHAGLIFDALPHNNSITELEIRMCHDHGFNSITEGSINIVLTPEDIHMILTKVPSLTSLTLTGVALSDVSTFQAITNMNNNNNNNWPAQLTSLTLNACTGKHHVLPGHHQKRHYIDQYPRLPFFVFNGIPDSIVTIAYSARPDDCSMHEFCDEAKQTHLPYVTTLTMNTTRMYRLSWKFTLRQSAFLPRLKHVNTTRGTLEFPLRCSEYPIHPFHAFDKGEQNVGPNDPVPAVMVLRALRPGHKHTDPAFEHNQMVRFTFDSANIADSTTVVDEKHTPFVYRLWIQDTPPLSEDERKCAQMESMAVWIA